jgi:hypothetical protein
MSREKITATITLSGDIEDAKRTWRNIGEPRGIPWANVEPRLTGDNLARYVNIGWEERTPYEENSMFACVDGDIDVEMEGFTQWIMAHVE